MGKRGTALLVAAVAGLGVAAGVDALRGGGDPAGGSAPSESDRTTTASEVQKLTSRQVTGVLHLTIRVRPGLCTLRSVALPSLEETSAVDVGSCRIATSPGGRVAAGGPCPGSSISVVSPTQPVVFEGCAPAWKPDGTLTFVRRGRVMEVVNGCTRPAPGDCLRRTPVRNRPGEAIRELAWLDGERLAAVIQGPGRLNKYVSVFERGRRVNRPEPFIPGLAYLRPFGEDRLLIRAGSPPGAALFLLDRRGRPQGFSGNALPQFLADGQAVAVSPDGAWVASTRAGAVHVYRLGGRRPLDPVRIDIDAFDLGWGTA
jgi:hypothetical protein